MKSEQKVQLAYDRLNTRYNRLWEQVTNIGLFVLATLAAYVITLITLMTLEKNSNAFITLASVNYILLGIAVLVGSVAGVLCMYLVLTRKALTDLFCKNEVLF